MENLILNHFLNSDSENFNFNWYQDANKYCLEVSKEFNIPLYKAVGILAALSPRNKWERNKKDLRTLISQRENGKYGTFHNNRDKAIKILDADSHEEVEKLLTGRKIFSFYHNIFYCHGSNLVTVDVWAARSVGIDTITPKLYGEIEDAYVNVADSLGLLPSDLQAICWLTVRGKIA